MMRKTGLSKLIGGFALALVVIAIGISLFRFIMFAHGTTGFGSERKKQLIYGIDHAALATEARSFAKQWRSRFGMPDPEPQMVPVNSVEIGVSLGIPKPRSIAIFKNHIEFEFGGMPVHYGVVVFDEGLAGSGTKKLAEGVWFYSENGRYPGPNGEEKKGPAIR